MKKKLCLLLAIVLCFSLCGCDVIKDLVGEVLEKAEGFIDLPAEGNDWLSGEGDEWFSFGEEALPPEMGGAVELWPGENEVIQETPTDTTEPPVEEVETVVMPHFEQQPLAYAAQWLDAVGIGVEVVETYTDTVEEGCVISQSIPAGETVPVNEGVVLRLVVSLGVEECPYEYSQKLTVTAPSGSSYATATLYVWENGDWQTVAVYSATVGKNGLGTAAEGSRRTPQGTYDLGVILSANSISTNMQVYTVTGSTCVVDDSNSRYYNMIMEEGDVPSGTSCDRIGRGLTNGATYATIYIEHNGSGFSSENVTPGKGSAIGLRGQYGSLSPTYGDVDISYSDMIDLLSRLDATKNPVIEIIAG